MPLVIDASALVEIVLRSSRGVRATALIKTEDLVAPDLLNAEALHALRRMNRHTLSDQPALEAIARLKRARVQRVRSSELIDRAWQLRHNLTAYDAMYVALAEKLGCAVMTGDNRLARSPTLTVPIITI